MEAVDYEKLKQVDLICQRSCHTTTPDGQMYLLYTYWPPHNHGTSCWIFLFPAVNSSLICTKIKVKHHIRVFHLLSCHATCILFLFMCDPHGSSDATIVKDSLDVQNHQGSLHGFLSLPVLVAFPLVPSWFCTHNKCVGRWTNTRDLCDCLSQVTTGK